MVLEGELSLSVNQETFLLKANDTINFTASAKHCYENSGNGMLKAAIINYYPA
jgi:mannose-6-phosphate isomerase-like protein (cupin superfamily)